MKKFMVMTVIMMMVLVPTVSKASVIEERVSEIISGYLAIDETDPTVDGDNDEFLRRVDSFATQCENLAEALLSDPDLLAQFRKEYSESDAATKTMLDPVVDLVLEGSNARGLGDAPENYPGYGYPEPGYKYRKGQETERETLSVFWVKENKTVEQGQTIKTTMELSIAAGWGQTNTANGNIENFQIGSTSNLNVNGSMKTVCEVTFTTRTVLVTQCTVKHQRTKVWHELWRIKKGFLGIGTSGSWMLCGKTYEIIQEATGEEVVETPPTVF